MSANRLSKRLIPVLAASMLPESGIRFSRADTPATAWQLGADVSGLAGSRRENYQENGAPGIEISIMKAPGWNAFRLRVFVSPVRRVPNNSLENTIALAKQIKAAGATFLPGIHYSDTWVDPKHQTSQLPEP